MQAAEQRLWAARREGAPRLSSQIEARLRELAMPRARFEVAVGDEPGSESVVWRLGANPGEPVLPLAKVASGGELARTMLAARLALGPASTEDGEGPATLIFDEVDAGIGGEAAVAVGRALAALGRDHQVLVVTHLPQVAAFAHSQLVVRKDEVDGRTLADVTSVDGGDRIVELSRMLSGSPDSETARRHAEELLERVRADGDDRRRGSHSRRVRLG
jgi:DNA repair protein RecN (Recombination protein N)